MRVVADTNVLVSALIADGPPARVLELARTSQVEMIVPDLALEELLRVLGIKLGWERSRLRDAAAAVENLASYVASAPSGAPARTGDPADGRILTCALSESADVLVTGDRKHLLPLQEIDGVRILLPQQLLAELAAS